MSLRRIISSFLATLALAAQAIPAQERADQQPKDLGLQLAGNPPLQMICRTPPAPPVPTATFETRAGFTLVTTLDGFRAAIRKDGQKIRMKPGVYRAKTCDPPIDGQEHIFAVTGSRNHFDLRGVVFETPVSVQSKLSGKAHVSDTWHIYGSGNTFEGGYFQNVIDMPYPTYRVTENEFEIRGDNSTFLNCIFVIRGSVPFGYSDFYGKGGPNFGRLNKHSFMSIQNANNTTLVGCRVYQQSFGHCVHFHTVDGALIRDCHFTGTLRPTNDIFRETVGRASEYGFQVMYRGKRHIPHDEMIPLTEDGVRSYENVRNITVVDTVVERMRGCFQLLCVGDVMLDNVTVREAGDFGFDLSSGDKGRVTMRNCRADIAYNPVFNLTRGKAPKGASYEMTILDPPDGARPTPRASLGIIAGDTCMFTLHDGTTRPVAEEANVLRCGGRRGLVNSTVTNHTTARLILDKHVRNCLIRSHGPVEDNGQGNTIVRLGLE